MPGAQTEYRWAPLCSRGLDSGTLLFLTVYFMILSHIIPADSGLFYLGEKASEPNWENITYTSSVLGQTLCSGHGKGLGGSGTRGTVQTSKETAETPISRRAGDQVTVHFTSHCGE